MVVETESNCWWTEKLYGACLGYFVYGLKVEFGFGARDKAELCPDSKYF